MSSMRIGGLASGFDIDQIVSDLMKVERMRVDTLIRKTGCDGKSQTISRLI